MNARELTAALGGCWSGKNGIALCPAHDDHDPSLSITDGDHRLLLKCFAGCAFDEIRDALASSGHWHGSYVAVRATAKPAKVAKTDRRREEAASRIWQQCRDIKGTVADCYLRNRGITLPRPPCLAFHPGLRHSFSREVWPALVAAVVDAEGHQKAIQRVFLDRNGDKANVKHAKMSLAPTLGCSVRLGPVARHIGISEGIETGLSVMQMYGLPVWAALGPHADRMRLPPDIRHVTVFGDNGKPGHEIANKAAAAIHRSGRLVDLAFPPSEYSDFNDLLMARDGVAA